MLPQEIERCQREAEEEVKMATEYLERVQAHRALHPIGETPARLQVKNIIPLRPRTNKDGVCTCDARVYVPYVVASVGRRVKRFRSFVA